MSAPRPKSTVNFRPGSPDAAPCRRAVRDGPGLAGRGLDAVGLLEEQDAESVEPGILDAEPVLGFVHAEAAGAARTSREEHVAVDDRLAGHAAGFQTL